MLFNSYIFIFIFAPIVYGLYWFALKTRLSRHVMLTIASYIFYGYWDWRFAFLLFGTSAVDYYVGGRIAALPDGHKGRKRWLLVSCISNLGVLGFFKYCDFFIESFKAALGSFGIDIPVGALGIILPVGISFYTFQSLSYTIDVYRKELKPADSFITFLCFVALFPQLVAGPIIRYSQLAEQIEDENPSVTPERVAWGIYFFCVGLAKKVLVADVVAAQVAPLFEHHAGLGLAGAWVAMLGYALQIYFDFSGYSDMAVGLGHLLGLDFPQNFNSPYQALNPADFWRRWHISLSTWLRDYLYIPLGGNRKGPRRTYINLALTMLLGGLWHGAAVAFVLWGAYHGALLAIHRALHDTRLGKLWPSQTWAKRILMFVLVLAGWVLFKSGMNGVAMAGDIYAAMLGLKGLVGNASGVNLLLAGLTVTGLVAMTMTAPNSWELKPRWRAREAVTLAVMFVLVLTRIYMPSPFLYFQF